MKNTERGEIPSSPHGERTLAIVREGYDFDLRDHGVPVDRALALSLRVGRDPVSGNERIYVGLNAVPTTVFLSIDPQTGATEQYTTGTGCTGPWDMVVDPDGRVLMVCNSGHLFVFDPRRKSLDLAASSTYGFWNIVRGGDGKYYLGGNREAKLFRFDLGSGVLDDLGAMDSRQFGPRHGMTRTLAAGNDGFVYTWIGFDPVLIAAYDTVSGKSSTLLFDGSEKAGILIRGSDGAAYARGAQGETYRLDHGRAVPTPAEQCAPPAVEKLADGDSVRYSDMNPAVLLIGEGPRAREVPMTYTTGGAPIFHIARGPGGMIYGSSIMPLYLFRYDPATGRSENLGRGAPASGEIYSFGVCDGKLYCASYGGTYFLVYDPAQPFRTGKGYHDWHYNPRVISTMGAGHCRPRAMTVDSRKRVWVGSNSGPEYGCYDGGLFCYDTVAGTEQNNPMVVPNHSIMAVTADDAGELVFGGTELNRGGAEAAAAKDAVVFAWDVAVRKVRWSVSPVPGETGVTNLIHLRGKLYGTSRPKGHYFVVDAVTGKTDRVLPSPISDAAEQSMGLAADGNFYGTTWPSLFRWRPDGEVETLCVVWGDEAKRYGGALFRGGSAISGDRIYFYAVSRLLSMRLPLDRS